MDFKPQKTAKSKNGLIFTFNTAIESYEYTDFKNVENFEEKKLTILEPQQEKKIF